jgi:hypothetical protein
VVARSHLSDGKRHSLGFYPRIGIPHRARQRAASLFKPCDNERMMDDAHGIGLEIAHAKSDLDNRPAIGTA